MSDYFYMRSVHPRLSWNTEQLVTFGDQKGAVSLDPFAAYKRQQLAHERYMLAKHGFSPDRYGRMFAYWRLERKMPWHEALPIARSTPPERVCVLVYGDSVWTKIDFVLPPGELIGVEQYKFMLPNNEAAPDNRP